MKLKMLLNLTAFAFFVLVTTFPSQADPQKMYGIQGDKLSIATTVPAPNAYSVKGKIYTTKDADEAKNYSKEGLASYYHLKFNGNKTASGDIYNSSLFTAAHKTLPINSYALVTNLHNNRKVIVRINDRGPFSDKRLIDLSHAAAKELGLIARGTGQVRIEALHVAKNGQLSGAATKTLAMHAKTKEAAERLGLNKNILVSQIAAKNISEKDSYRLKMLELTSRSQADKLITQLSLENVKTEVNRAGSKYEIHIGPFDNKEQLTQVRSQLQKMVSNKPLIVYTYKN
ncbi:septal ring lytic transglycosylase RlpA family protein [Haemophilus haemolyticus]|jgi:rlpA-like protein|uniref:septal ring lytic transglycosylase RlpA family protein n=1 Tax=Haemophilus TaxID=724 RepID=UPI000DAECB86|nr:MULTISPECIES: septal ring lytic transglycosylase RlpA family protein [Haemophilus]UJZ89150.1 septal ring lytic transglycosylase RlpA family protein [Haemophilus seminalis]MBS5999663.1 septal ring lytic transglycosylase RlpA family protein [Haemophilus haemolyticus]MBS6050762.1 septal ring lytic transglycosylase RlpA family protein [Haemophilus haemolyticus]RDE68483.1 septal ring lytic transglycosylase RlpA family protein [Haemophilus haemolyticus]TPH05121.1 septal ring lytic transglycosylas